MIQSETTIRPHVAVGRLGRLRAFLLTGAVQFALSAVAHAGGDRDGFVIRSGRAELRSSFPLAAGKVPVVFVHGMLGSPDNWTVMIDRLATDASVGARFQLLTFGYDSLQPIAESGRELVATLTEARRRLDPDGRDPAFDQVVLVGHSLGGLVVRSAANALGPAPAEGPASSSNAQRLPARPRVARVIFVATPHRGVLVDGGVMRTVGAWVARGDSPWSAPRSARGEAPAPRPATSVEQLDWDNQFLLDLERSGAAAGVPYHSIIAALGDPAASGATDGIVPVASARLGGARSEVVVRAPHVCFQHTEVIQEVRRVLRGQADEPLMASSPPPQPEEARLIVLRRPAALPGVEPPHPNRPGAAVTEPSNP